MESLGLDGSTGSSEKSGSRLSHARTCSAVARYSRFTEAAGSMVEAMPATCESFRSTKQHMPRDTGHSCNLGAMLVFRGMCSTFQPISNSSRRSRLSLSSFSVLARSCSCSSLSRSWAKHSPWSRALLPSSLLYANSPTGNRQWLQICNLELNVMRISDSLGDSAPAPARARLCASCARLSSPGSSSDPVSGFQWKACRLLL
mmetsp:Transcript_11334/g.34119  ORF Transcript_11334/g.34119 Transcript_11334/m.34119 type:complete len:202 (+) Transcript_11334:120-725(+)